MRRAFKKDIDLNKSSVGCTPCLNEAKKIKESQINKAEGEQQADILRAEGESKARIMIAEAEAKAIRGI